MNVYIAAASDMEHPDRRQRWGDYWFKDSLGKAIGGLGHTLTENALEAEVVINCHGAAVQRLPEWTFNILWIIGHPDAVTAEQCLEYDAVFAESAEFAAHIGAQHLPGASDMVPMDLPKIHGAVFVGNYRPGRVLDPRAEPLEVWGEGWRDLGDAWQGTEYPHGQLNELYASSRVLLNDTHADMAKWGMHNPRYYDIMAVQGEKVPTFAECAKVLMGCMPERRMLDLGCGKKARPGMVGIDKSPTGRGPGVMLYDLEMGLPKDGYTYQTRVIVADNILEHITNLIPLLNDCHRSLEAFRGRMHIRVPNAKNAVAAFADPTHVRAFVPETFDYFDISNARWQEYGKGYGIQPWRIVYRREAGRFIDVMMRPAHE